MVSRSTLMGQDWSRVYLPGGERRRAHDNDGAEKSNDADKRKNEFFHRNH